MTKAGNKGGSLRDKLDGNELDLSLSDLNEVPVKELVSRGPRGPGAHRRVALALAWAASVLIPPFLRVKMRWGEWDEAPWEAASGPSVLPGVYTCHFGTVPEDGATGGGGNCLSGHGLFYGSRVKLPTLCVGGLPQRSAECPTPSRYPPERLLDVSENE